VLRMLELVGRADVPVYRGSTYPLVNTMEVTKRWEQTYGDMAYKGAWMEKLPDYNTVNRAIPRAGPDSADAQRARRTRMRRRERRRIFWCARCMSILVK
jgi:hypothetical protein